jgi:dTDP-glucose pyrophosphorylase
VKSGIDGVRVAPQTSLRDVISVINDNAQQFALVVDSTDKLLGVITDGDVRRAILRGCELDSSADEVMNSQPRFTSDAQPLQHVYELMAEADVRHMPLVNAEGIVTGYATLDELAHPEQISSPVILMAGGKGQRLYPLTKDVPKPMLPVGDTPIIGIILERVRAQGFTDVRISVNYLAEVIEDYVGDGSEFGLNVQYIYEDSPLGTAGALASQRESISEPFIVMNSDLLTNVNLRDLLSFHSKNQASATVGVREHIIQVPFGVVSVENSFVTALTEKPLHRSLVSAGIYALEPQTLSSLVVDQYCDMPTLLSNLMEVGKKIAAFPIHESWLDVGRPEDLTKARNDAKPQELS